MSGKGKGDGGKGKGDGKGKGGKGKGDGKGKGKGGKGKGAKGKGGKGKGAKGGAKTVVEPHRHEGVFIARGKEDVLVTRSSVPGDAVYGEKRISVEEGEGDEKTKIEYRVWNPFRSKCALPYCIRHTTPPRARMLSLTTGVRVPGLRPPSSEASIPFTWDRVPRCCTLAPPRARPSRMCPTWLARAAAYTL